MDVAKDYVDHAGSTYEEEPDTDAPNVILGACANLSFLDGDGFIHPTHYSVMEFFTSNEATMVDAEMKLLWDRAQAQQQLAHICISYLVGGRLQLGSCNVSFTAYSHCGRDPLSWYAEKKFDYHVLHHW